MFYSTTFTATGGLGNYGWSLTGGGVPGLTLSPSGILSGTPSASGTYSLTVAVTSGGQIATGNFRITVSQPATGTLSSTLRNVNGSSAPSPSTRQILFTSPSRTLAGNPVTFSCVPPGTYWLEGWSAGAFPGVSEFWASQIVTVSAGQTTSVTLTRTYPYVASVVVKNDATGAQLGAGQAAPLGTRLRAEVSVRNDVPGTTLTARVEFVWGRDKLGAYDDYQAISNSVNGNGGTRLYTFRFTPTDTGQYSYFLVVQTTLANGNTPFTDPWPWNQTVRVE